ncbi:putative RNA polymerase sigma factor SigF 2 [Bacillus phage phiAGATE]|uniref:RNA polymerase sigma factor SigF 2 n=1 Tax=Bacillus phage phiAGATE TaxID=1204533 RepID=L0L988_9CAUD|nr:RNA polymerase sigma factor [Bacillus phage phiAGATE]AGB62713.1 putative RNA polymerase sigma factor SigF 2 [Bacillus phage phiAGATE]
METRNKYVEENLKLIWKEVHRQIGESSPIDKDDAFQEGALAMILALDRFDPSKGAKKSTYITNFVKGYIQMLKRDTTSVHVPLRVVTKAQEINKKELQNHSIAEIAEDLNTTYETAAAALFFSPTSAADNQYQLFTSLNGANEEYYSPSYEFESSWMLGDMMKESLDCLTDVERRAIDLVYYRGYDRSAAGKLINRDKESVRQAEKRALRKLRKKLGGTLNDYTEN